MTTFFSYPEACLEGKLANNPTFPPVPEKETIDWETVLQHVKNICLRFDKHRHLSYLEH